MIERLHYITQGDVAGYRHSRLAKVACENGIKWVQLRIKESTSDHFLREALETKSICQHYGAKLIINDNVAVAKEIQADGVHLGKEDMDPAKARVILGDKMIIGATANTLGDILDLHKKSVDYVGLGPFRFTTTKKKLSPVLGLEGYEHIMRELEKLGIRMPVIAIGGIVTEDIQSIIKTGVYGIAVASVINKAEDMGSVIQKIVKALNYGEIAHSR